MKRLFHFKRKKGKKKKNWIVKICLTWNNSFLSLSLPFCFSLSFCLICSIFIYFTCKNYEYLGIFLFLILWICFVWNRIFAMNRVREFYSIAYLIHTIWKDNLWLEIKAFKDGEKRGIKKKIGTNGRCSSRLSIERKEMYWRWVFLLFE